MVVEEKKDGLGQDVYELNGTLYKITGFKNGNAYPMSIRTARWSLTINPGQYIVDREGKKATDKKLLSYVGAGRLSVDREVVRSADNFRADSEKTAAPETTEDGSDGAVKEPAVADGESSGDGKKAGSLKFNKMKE